MQEEIHHIGIGCIILLALSKRRECPSRLMTNIVCIPANGPVVFKFILGKMKIASYLELKCSSPLHFGILKTLFFKTIGKKTFLCSLGWLPAPHRWCLHWSDSKSVQDAEQTIVCLQLDFQLYQTCHLMSGSLRLLKTRLSLQGYLKEISVYRPQDVLTSYISSSLICSF